MAYEIRNTGGVVLATADTQDEARKLADECCENIRQCAVERDGVDPGYFADDVVIVDLTAELADEHEADCYEDEGEAAYGRN